MYGVNKIEISLTGLKEMYAIIDLNSKAITINNKSFLISEYEIDNLFRIIRLWNKEYINNQIIDSEEFNIKIYSNDKIDTIKGKGNYPNNYNEFKNWLGEVYVRTTI